jgi:antitoxin YefM
MATETTYTSLRENLATVLDQVVDQQETVIVRRRGSRDVALIPASELAGLMETAHLLRSPRNARRLLTALHRAERGKTKPATAAQLRREILGGTGSTRRRGWAVSRIGNDKSPWLHASGREVGRRSF